MGMTALRRVPAGWLPALVGLWFGAGGPGALADTICIHDVGLVDVVAGRTVPGIRVVVDGQRIRSVETAEPSASGCGHDVDGTGRYLIPGLWDMHTHWLRTESHWPVYVANGVTGARDMFGSSDAGPRPAGAPGSLAPRAHLAGPIVDGPPGFWPGSDIAATPQDARRIVREQVAAGFDFIKVYALLSADAYGAVLEAAQDHGVAVAGHVPLSSSAAMASRLGQRSIEHLDDVAVSCASDEETLRLQDGSEFFALMRRERDAYGSFDADKCLDLARTFIANDTWMVPTYAVMEAATFGAGAAPFVAERARYFDDRTLELVLPGVQDTPEQLALLRQVFANSQASGEFLRRQGVRFLAGSDAMNINTFPGFAIHDELRLMVQAGFPAVEALRAATLNAAEFLGRLDELGSVEAGKSADLVLLDGDPLVDIRNTGRIRGVFLRGHYFSRDDLDELLSSVRRPWPPE